MYKNLNAHVHSQYRLPVEIKFTANHQKDYSFTLKCKVHCKMTFLSMKVKAEGYSIKLGLSHSSPDTREVDLSVKQSDARVLDLGPVQINEKRMEQLTIFNQSLYSFEYRWTLTHRSMRVAMFSITPECGKVSPDNRQVCQLLFEPTTKMKFKNYQLTLEVRYSCNNWCALYVISISQIYCIKMHVLRKHG